MNAVRPDRPDHFISAVKTLHSGLEWKPVCPDVFAYTCKLREGRMELTWSKRMSVGNETLDSEHRKILDLVNEVDRAIRVKDGARFAETLKRLENATRMHFGNEARIAQAINYSFDQHHLEHQYILKEMRLVEKELAACQGSWSESIAEHYFQFLSTWAVDHIEQDDMKMKALLQTYPYDFRTDGLES
jgi:hemerythrin-like metal-binding protein